MLLTAVDLAHRWALTIEDEVVPVHKLFDKHGQRTESLEAAVSFTAGKDAAIYAYRVSEIPERELN